MRNKILIPVFFAAFFTAVPAVAQEDLSQAQTDIGTAAVLAQFVSIRPGADSAVAVRFELAKDWHFYADRQTAPGQMSLTVKAQASGLAFTEPVLPASQSYYDQGLQKNVQVFSDKFTIYIPFKSQDSSDTGNIDISVRIEGAVCSGMMCRISDFGELRTSVRLDAGAQMASPAFNVPVIRAEAARYASYSAPAAFLIAILAGLVLNVMPCVWPVIPIIVMRIWNQAGEKRAKSFALGLAFCFGILLFFAAIAAANIVLRIGYGVIFQWGDHFRNPAFVLFMTLLMVVLGLYMFGLFTIGIPASLAGKGSGTGAGFAGNIGMGFLAALLATPCSFAILAAAFAWAQTQTLPVATFTIMLIGAGMAVPYLVLTLIPKLLDKLPKPGGWMDHVKHGMGFLLIVIAVKLLSALPEDSRMNALLYAVVLSFCVWIWGCWVTYSTPPARKWFVRTFAVVLAAAFAWLMLPGFGTQSQKLIDWQDYNSAKIAEAIDNDQPVLIKFTADWCTSCVVVERMVFKRKDVAELIKQKNVLAIKADTTLAGTKATLDLANIYNEPGVPVTVLHLPAGKERHLRGLFGKNELLKLLNELTDKRN